MIHEKHAGFQMDISCAGRNHNISTNTFHTFDEESKTGRLKVISCRRCGTILSSHRCLE